MEFNGKNWKSKYGFIILTVYGKPYNHDGLNEVGLLGFAQYSVCDKDKTSKSMSEGDLMQWMLFSFFYMTFFLSKFSVYLLTPAFRSRNFFKRRNVTC